METVVDKLRKTKPSDEMKPTLHPVIRTRKDTADTFTLELGLPESGEPFTFSPGQFNMIYQFGEWHIKINNGYSLGKISDCHEIKSAWDELITTLGNGVVYPNQLKKWKKKYQSILESTYIPDEGANL